LIYCQNDLAISGTTLAQNKYTKIPLAQVSLIATGGIIENIGTAESTNVILTVSVFDSSSLVYTESSNPQTIVAGASLPINFNGFKPTFVDTYTTIYDLTFTETDQDPSNNKVSSTIEVTSNVYAKDNNITSISLGYNGITGKLGQQFDIIKIQDLVSVSFQLIGSNPGEMTFVSIWDMVADSPNTKIAETNPVNIISGSNLYTVDLIGGPLTLQPGQYVFIVEQTTTNNIGLEATSEIFTTGTTWFKGDTAEVWDNLENIGFEIAFIIRPNFQDDSLGVSDNFLTNKSAQLYPNPVKDILTINATQPIDNITMYNVMGQKIASYKELANNKINVSLLSKGFYILNIESNGAIQSIKFLKQ